VPRTVIKTIRSERRKRAWDYIKPEIDRMMDRQVKPKMLSYFERVVESWEHKPAFKARKITNQNMIAIDVWPTGPHAKVWTYVSGGTRPHIIRPRRASRLVFRTGYKPRTSRGGHYGGPGVATGKKVCAREVHHPGSYAREFEKHFLRWFRSSKIFTHSMENAVRRGLRAYRRAGRVRVE